MPGSIEYVKIHPAIGIARVGNHPTAYFIGPEKPYDYSVPQGGYKADHNGECKVKRQAVRFHLFGYDANGNVVKEIKKQDADIRWTVVLANKKAAWEKFKGPGRNSWDLRNSHVPLDKRRDLIIGPANATLPGNQAGSKKLDRLSFLSINPANSNQVTVEDVLLGELCVENDGCAVVLAGRGRSESPAGTDIVDYANNPGWFDDIADGPVDASVKLRENGGAREVPVRGAWVITAPPNFAPRIQAVVTLYDMLFDRAIREKVLRRPSPPSFSEHIYPLLEASLNVRHVYAIEEEGQNNAYHFFRDLLYPHSHLSQRESLLSWIRVPKSLRSQFPNRSRAWSNMPRLRDANNNWDQDGRKEGGFTLTEAQYLMLDQWSRGEVNIIGVHGQPPKPPSDITPEGLDRAALMNCVGGAFYPGIECGWFLESSSAVDMDGDDFVRMKRGQFMFGDPLEAGDITKHMAVPWQADFFSCTRYGNTSPGWWPSARPNEVSVPSEGRKPWDRGHDSYEKMAAGWWKLGFVVESQGSFQEEQRN